MLDAITSVTTHVGQKEVYAICGACVMLVGGAFLAVTKTCVRRYKRRSNKVVPLDNVAQRSTAQQQQQQESVAQPQWDV